MILETASLISISTWLGNKLLDKGFETVYSKITEPSFNERFYQIASLSASRLQRKHPEALGGNIEYLFKHETVFNELIKLLFINSKVNLEIINSKFDSETLPDGFILEYINILREELYLDEHFAQILSNKEMYLTLVGINENLNEIADATTLTAHELKTLTNLLSSRFKRTFSQGEFIKKYKQRILNNLSQVNFIGLGVDLSIKKGKRKNLEDLFVEPTFSTYTDNLQLLDIVIQKVEREEGVLKFENIFNFTKSLVILGNPGSGKSMLTKFITLKLCQETQPPFKNDHVCNTIPFRVELRKYFDFKKQHHGSVSKYLRHQLETEFMFSTILDEDIELILTTQPILLIFDGLDEIFEVSDKIEIRNDINNFSEAYPGVRTITTSRIIGYEDTPLKESNTLKLKVNGFNDNQIRTYVKNWYEVEEEDVVIRNREVDDLQSKVHLISNELISNPLLLSLIVILYRNNLKVPESKLDIYQSCTKTLVDKWDTSKGIKTNLSDEIYKRKDTIFADLAFWQYTEQGKPEGKVTYPRAKNTVAKSLGEKLQLTDEFTTDDTAEKFLEYAEKRSLYFDNNFTHKTFLEYYTAYWIFTNIEKKHKKIERDELIAKHVENPYWHIVLELLLNLIDKDQADDEIIDELIVNQLKINTSSSKFFLQVFDTLKNSSLGVLTIISKHLITELIENKSSNSKLRNSDSTFFLLSKYINNEYYRPSIETSFNESFMDYKSRNRGSKLSQDMRNVISLYIEMVGHRRTSNDLKHQLNLFSEYFEELKESDPYFYISLTFYTEEKKLNLNPVNYAEKFIDRFGIKAFLTGYSSKYDSFTYYPWQTILINNIFYSQDRSTFDKYLNMLKMKGVNKNQILKNVFDNSIFLNSLEQLESLLDKYSTPGGKLFPELFAAIAYCMRFNHGYFKIEDSEIEQTIKIKIGGQLQQHMLTLFNLEDRSLAIDYLTENFNLKRNIIEP